MIKSEIRTESLLFHKNLIPMIAQWYLSVFARQGTIIEKCENALLKRLNTDCLDCCFCAFIDDEVVGTVSLTANDIPTKSELSPCVTHLFVSEKYRRQNIGQSLVEYAKQKSKEMNFQKAYLYTTSKTIHQWYEKLGWRIIEEGVVDNTKIKIMECEL